MFECEFSGWVDFTSNCDEVVEVSSPYGASALQTSYRESSLAEKAKPFQRRETNSFWWDREETSQIRIWLITLTHREIQR